MHFRCFTESVKDKQTATRSRGACKGCQDQTLKEMKEHQEKTPGSDLKNGKSYETKIDIGKHR